MIIAWPLILASSPLFAISDQQPVKRAKFAPIIKT